jgi:tetratricopeptide (TPR) repeat protein
MKPKAAAFVLPLLALSAATAWACLWDTDTLQMERMRFPGVLEIITGKFVRHSRAFYDWRITDRQKKLATRPDDPALVDDLAVAYAKLGRPEEGIPLLERVLKQHPDRYETLSNLGTLLFFAGRLDESKATIRRALDINPNAHFGRERYQLLLTEYLQQSEIDSAGVMCSKERSGFDGQGFAAAINGAINGRVILQDEERSIHAATKGVLGMMHFADYQSPILLEALGDLLMVGRPDENMTQLAARAYLRAAHTSNNPSAAAKFRQLAGEAIRMHLDFQYRDPAAALAQLEHKLNRELADAAQWYAAIEANEKRWIAEGRDVDSEFAKVYYDSLDQTLTAAHQRVNREWPELSVDKRNSFRVAGLLCVAPLALVTSFYMAARWYWKRRWSHRAA